MMAMPVLNYTDYVSTDPVLEPVTVKDAKRNSDVDDDYRDVDFSRWITEARKQIEHDARLSLINQTRVRKLDAFPAETYIPCIGPLVSVTSLDYIDTGGNTQTMSASNYEVDTNRDVVWLAYGESWPATRGIQNSVTLTYVTGHGTAGSDVPQAAVAAIHLFCRQRHDNPDMAVDEWTSSNAYRSLINQMRGGVYP